MTLALKDFRPRLDVDAPEAPVKEPAVRPAQPVRRDIPDLPSPGVKNPNVSPGHGEPPEFETPPCFGRRLNRLA